MRRKITLSLVGQAPSPVHYQRRRSGAATAGGGCATLSHGRGWVEMASQTGVRLLLIVCQSSTAEEAIERLTQAGACHYTVHHGFLGAGETGRHEGTATWPGQNTLIFCCLSGEQSDGVVRALAALHDSRPGHTLGLKVFALPAEELL